MDDLTRSLNDDIANKRLPMTVILCFYLAIGVVGNSIVLFIYLRKINDVSGSKLKDDQTNSRYYIPSLAFFDLVAIVAHALSSIIQNNFFVVFPSQALCKSLWFISWCSSVISGLIILLIAIQRFMCIGLQTGKDLSLCKLRGWLVTVIIIAVVCTAPILYFVDIRIQTTEYEEANITVRICSFRDDNFSTDGEIYFVMMLAGTLINMLAAGFFYILIGKVIYTKFRKSSKSSIVSFIKSGADELSSSDDGRKSSDIVNSQDVSNVLEFKNDQTDAKDKDVSCTGSQISLATTATVDSTWSLDTLKKFKLREFIRSKPGEKTVTLEKQEIRKTASARRTVRGRKARTRFTSMFLLILIIYVISYIPPFLVQMVTGNSLKMLKNTTTVELNTILFFEGTVLINHFANPFVYGYFDLVFRKEFKNFICRCSGE